MDKNKSLIKKVLYIVSDFFICVIGLKIAYIIRFGYPIPANEYILLKRSVLVFAIIQVVVLYLIGVYKLGWKYTLFDNLRRVSLSIILSFFIITTIVFYNRYLSFSRLVIIYDHLIILLLLLSIRIGLKFYPPIIRDEESKKERCIIIGAGEAGQSIVEKIKSDVNSKIEPLAFLDDDESKMRKKYFGVPVVDRISKVKEVSESLKIKDIIISIPSATGEEIRKIIRYCQDAKLSFRIVPGIKEIIEGDVNLEDIRYFEPEDLLGRETVKVDESEIMRTIEDKCILVTGGVGSIGRELIKQLLKYRPQRVVAIDQNETGISEISRLKNNRLKVYLGDITDYERMDLIVNNERPDFIFHTAAYKHVPVLEENLYEAVKTNIIGTINMMRISNKYSVKKFVFISTDKAVDCEGVMGMSKRIGEKLILETGRSRYTTLFIAVRFGNVISSSGSVVPIFVEQIKKGGCVTVTHPEMVRYFMTIPESCRLVLQASTFEETGVIYVLDMGEPIKIVDLARTLISLYGKKEIKIEFSGIRCGEKIEEKLFYDDEKVIESSHPKIKKVFSDKNFTMSIDEVEKSFNNIKDEEMLRQKLKELAK
ncbi:MAG: nucleoside-diphosphate sugar epimerase/dehydratase [Candidatus Hydrogenedentota bacterium]